MQPNTAVSYWLAGKEIPAIAILLSPLTSLERDGMPACTLAYLDSNSLAAGCPPKDALVLAHDVPFGLKAGATYTLPAEALIECEDLKAQLDAAKIAHDALEGELKEVNAALEDVEGELAVAKTELDTLRREYSDLKELEKIGEQTPPLDAPEEHER